MGGAADGTTVATHGDSLALLLDVLEELHSALQLEAVDGLGGLAGVLEGHTQVSTAGAGRLGGSNLLGSVPNLDVAKSTWSASQPSCHLQPCRRPDLECLSLFGSFSTFRIGAGDHITVAPGKFAIGFSR